MRGALTTGTGDLTLHNPAVMLNLLGDHWQGPDHRVAPDWEIVLKHVGAHLHLYGKREARPGRKMGHATICDADLTRALAIALKIKTELV